MKNKPKEYVPSQADLNNRSRQLNPKDAVYKSSRGIK